MSETPLIDAMLAEHAELEKQLADPALHADAPRRARPVAGSRCCRRSLPPTESLPPPATTWLRPASCRRTIRRSPMR